MGEQVQLVLSPLLAHLSQTEYAGVARWQDWHIQRITGGWNSLLYRASHTAGDFAVKFSMADGRDRAGREYNALHVLERAGLNIAPKPILLDRTSAVPTIKVGNAKSSLCRVYSHFREILFPSLFVGAALVMRRPSSFKNGLKAR